MEKDFISFIQLAMVNISLLVAFIFTYYNWRTGWFGKLISIVLFLTTYGVYVSTLAATGMMVNFPHTFRTGLMVLYFIPAGIYIGIRTGFAKVPFHTTDLFHLVPALFYIVNFYPSIFTSAAVKRELINPENMRSFQEGVIFAPYAVLWISEVLLFFYMVKIYREFILQSNTHIKPYHQTTIILLIGFLGIQMMPPLFTILGSYDGQHRLSSMMIYVLTCISFNFILLSRPNIIYGNRIERSPFDPKQNIHTTSKGSFKSQNKNQVSERLKTGFNNSPKDVIISNHTERFVKTPEWNKIEKYLEESMAYLDSSFTQQDLINATGLTPFQIRTILKRNSKANFSAYINEKRIYYLLKKLAENPQWRNYKIGSLASQSGFNSINSFYLIFKKVTGIRPKEYIDNINKTV
jgi:AraC-like DNA-binding protein